MQASAETGLTSVSAEVSRWLLHDCRAAQVSVDAGVRVDMGSESVEVSRAALSGVDGAGSEVSGWMFSCAYMVEVPPLEDGLVMARALDGATNVIIMFGFVVSRFMSGVCLVL